MFENDRLTGAQARRERGRRDMRLAIIDAAWQIIAADGIGGLTIRAVAARLGYSPGALYEYFDSKDSILTALYFDGAGGLGAHCERAVAGLPGSASAIDALGVLAHAYRSFALEHTELYRLVFCTVKAPQPQDADGTEGSPGGFGTLVRVADQGVRDGSLVDLPAPVIACAAWSAVHGFVSLEISGHMTGSDTPGRALPIEDGRQRRNLLFDAVLRMVLFGFTKQEQGLQIP